MLTNVTVTWSLKGLIQFQEKGQRFTEACQENFDRMKTPEKLVRNIMVEIIGIPLLRKMPTDIPLRDSFSYFPGNGNIKC